LTVLVELQSQQPRIHATFRDKDLTPERIIWIPDRYRDSPTIAPSVARQLVDLRSQGLLEGLMVCTEPKAHFPYLAWAAKEGIDVLVDKPITVPPGFLTHGHRSVGLIRDFHALRRLQHRHGSRITVLVPRRAHAGYEAIRTLVQDFVIHQQVPITALRVSHAGGVWNMPNEWHREQHPYKYGYGGVLHSGYHQIDLFADLLRLNGLVDGRWGEQLVMSTAHTAPMDVHLQEGHRYGALFGSDHPSLVPSGPLHAMGEVDVKAVLRLVNGSNTVTLGSIDMMQTSLSTRTTPDPPEDPYKKMGRLRQEELSVTLGHLLTLVAEGDRFPGRDHVFTVRIGRNGLAGAEVYKDKVWVDGETVTRHGHTYHTDLTGMAHEILVTQWLNDEPTRSELADHELSVQILAGIFTSMHTQSAERPGSARVNVRGLGASMAQASTNEVSPSLVKQL
jgi:predicted dehydrogenase